MNNIQTIASMIILGSVAKKIAYYDSDLVVPISRPGFYVAGAGVLHRAAAVGVDALIALEVRFP